MKIIRRNEVSDVDRNGYLIKRLLTSPFQIPPKDVGFYETSIPRGSKCKEQWHKESYESVYFLTDGEAKLKGEIYEFKKGDLVFLEPGEKHEWLALKNEVVLFAMRFPNLLNDKYTMEDSEDDS